MTTLVGQPSTMTAQQRQGVGELEDRSGRLALVHGALREFIIKRGRKIINNNNNKELPKDYQKV